MNNGPEPEVLTFNALLTILGRRGAAAGHQYPVKRRSSAAMISFEWPARFATGAPNTLVGTAASCAGDNTTAAPFTVRTGRKRYLTVGVGGGRWVCWWG